MTFRLDAGAADTIAAHHEAAATTIDESAGSAPAAVDGGLASAYLADILAAVCTSAAEVAAVNLGTAELVRDVADQAGLTDGAIGDGFTSMSGQLP